MQQITPIHKHCAGITVENNYRQLVYDSYKCFEKVGIATTALSVGVGVYAALMKLDAVILESSGKWGLVGLETAILSKVVADIHKKGELFGKEQ